MAQLQVPDAPREFATQYHELLGVDYQSDQTEVDRRRSPDMVNMISDFGGNPIKRDGYREVGHAYASLLMVDGKMYGISSTNTEFNVSELELSGYEFDVVDSNTESGDIGTIMSAFAYQSNIYIVAENAFVRFDTIEKQFDLVGIGTNMMSTGATGASDPTYDGNIPLTVFGLKPDGTGGTVLYDKNVFSIYQQVSYQGDGSTTTFKIPNYTKIGNWVNVEVKNNDGDWIQASVTLGASTSYNGKKLDGTGYESCEVIDASVEFTQPPDDPDASGDPGADNVRITFAPFSMEELETGKYKGFYNETFVKLLSSHAVTFQNNRMFISEKYRIYYSDVSDPFKVSDLAWFDVDSEVIGFTRSNNYLAVLAKDNGRSTIYLASETSRVVDSQTGETESYFAVKESNSGIGAIAPKCIATLSDEPMFLSKTGVFGILTNWQSEKYAVNRSSRINRRLCKEPDLETAVGVAYNDYFYLAINGRMYVLDGRHKESDRAGNKPLEAYFFEGLPVIESMYVINDKMYFMSSGENAATYTWNEDLADTERYYDKAHLKEVDTVQYQISDSQAEEPTGEWVNVKPTPGEGEYLWYKVTFDDLSEEITLEEFDVGDKRLTGDAVKARWCSAFDDDGAPQKLKTLMKKGSMVTLVPHYKSGCEITLVKDGDVFQYLGRFDSSLQTFENISFNDFTFNANAVAVDIFTKKKIKKYKRLQIQIENNNAEPFGITQITKTFTVGNYAKR